MHCPCRVFDLHLASLFLARSVAPFSLVPVRPFLIRTAEIKGRSFLYRLSGLRTLCPVTLVGISSSILTQTL